MKKLYKTLFKWVGLILTHVIEYPNIDPTKAWPAITLPSNKLLWEKEVLLQL